jgi:hypothetical protein
MRQATLLTDAPGANASATIARFCSSFHRRRRSRPDITSTRLIAQSTSAKTRRLHQCQNEPDQFRARKAAAIGRIARLHCFQSSAKATESQKHIAIVVQTFVRLARFRNKCYGVSSKLQSISYSRSYVEYLIRIGELCKISRPPSPRDAHYSHRSGDVY